MEDERAARAEELLRFYRTLKKTERDLIRKLEDLDIYDGYGATPLDGMPKGASVAKDALIVEKRQDLRTALECVRNLKDPVQLAVYGLILAARFELSSIEWIVALERFCNDRSCKEIASNMDLEETDDWSHGELFIKGAESKVVAAIKSSEYVQSYAERCAESLYKLHCRELMHLITEGVINPLFLWKN